MSFIVRYINFRVELIVDYYVVLFTIIRHFNETVGLIVVYNKRTYNNTQTVVHISNSSIPLLYYFILINNNQLNKQQPIEQSSNQSQYCNLTTAQSTTTITTRLTTNKQYCKTQIPTITNTTLLHKSVVYQT